MLVIEDSKLPDEPVDVVVGVGIDVSRDGLSASPQSEAVALKALDLFDSRKARNILVVGGYKACHLTESAAMIDVIMAHGDSRRLENHMFFETESDRTWLNAECSLQVMEEYGWQSAIIVAQQWHARRVFASFKKTWGAGKEIFIAKAWSSYIEGRNSQRRLENALRFMAWDTAAFAYSKFKGFV